MRCATPLMLLALLSSGTLLAQDGAYRSAFSPSIGFDPPATISNPAPQPLPDAPSFQAAAQATSPQREEIHLPASFRPTWAVDRSRVGEKLSYGSASMVSMRNLVEALLIAGTPNLPSAPVQPNAPATIDISTATVYQDQMQAYGNAMDGWRRVSEDIMRYHLDRLETGLATAESRQFLSTLALPILLHQEARYRPAPIDATLMQRLANAAESIVLTHDDHGRVVPNYSKLGGTFAAGFAGKVVFSRAFNAPELNSTRFVMKYVGYSLAGDLATNVAHEMIRAAIEPDVEVYNLHGRSTEDSYYPLSVGGKFVYWARSTYSSRIFVQALLTAGIPSIGDQPVEPPPGNIVTLAQALAYDQQYAAYGNTIQTWRRHLENDVRYHEHRLIGGAAAAESQALLQNLALPVLLGVDPRYIPLGRGYDAGTRLSHAFKGLIAARTDSGGRSINYPVLIGSTGGAILAKQLYYPALGTPALETNAVMITTIGLNLAGDLVGNIWSEFSHRRGY